ncbi:MAG TPA: membrane protein insertase YidC [Verrucomicrobiae bacterium]|jgi:YidC/Oxa1 family membrane protein insertase|nr:membrane protein insertase YidC [Verrucomicrobiae bacterium]
MDRTGIIVVSICAILFVAWFVEEQKYQSHLPPQQLTTNTIVATQTETANSPAVSSTTATVSTPIFDTNAPEKLITVTNADAIYTFTSRGGGLQSIQLTKYPDSVPLRWKKEMATNGVATLNNHAPAPVLAILGDPSLVGDGNFTLTRTGDGVRAEKVLPDGLILAKEFHVSSNYLVYASVNLSNTSAKPLALPAQEWIVGTATPMGPDDNGLYLGSLWYNGTNSPQACTSSYFNKSTTALFFFPRTPKTIFEAGAGNVVWAAAHNQFFALIAMPKQPAQQVISRPVDLPSLTIDNQIPAAPPVGIQTAFVYPAQTIAANSSVERQIAFYAGPKEYRKLALIGEQFNNNADLVMQFGFFGFFAKALLLAMNWVHDVTKLGYGWVIVLITVIIKMLFWPLTAASTRSMKRMQALAPEVKLLKEKYKDDPQKFTQKQMELWKKNKVSPMGGCLPMLIQTPVFIGFFTMIRSAIELRGAHFLWVADLSKPDTLFMIPGIDFPFNLLPLLMGASMLWQSHLTPPSPGMDPSQQKMMRYMPLLFLVFLYNYSAGLALYWTVNNLLTVVQTKLTKSKQPVAAAVVVSPLTPLSKKKK